MPEQGLCVDKDLQIKAKRIHERLLDPNVRVCFFESQIRLVEDMRLRADLEGYSEEDFNLLELFEKMADNIIWK